MTFLKEHFDKLERDRAFEKLPDYRDVIRKAYIEALENQGVENEV